MKPVMKISSPRGLSRRGLVKRGFWGGGLLLLGGVAGLALQETAPVALPKEGLQVLNARELAVVEALAACMLPSGKNVPSLAEVKVGLQVDRILSLADAHSTQELKQLLGLFENALPVFLFNGRLRPFTRLSAEAQDEVLRGWRDSRLVLRRTGYQALRALLMAAYYASPLTWKAVGYPGPPLLRP